jgi:hypothetical protein
LLKKNAVPDRRQSWSVASIKLEGSDRRRRETSRFRDMKKFDLLSERSVRQAGHADRQQPGFRHESALRDLSMRHGVGVLVRLRRFSSVAFLK